MKRAEIAWRYYQPGVGVNPNTGLNYPTKNWHIITDWDLGTYIIALVDAEELGLIEKPGAWGLTERANMVLNFLETRPLASGGVPFLRYDSDSGQVYSDERDKPTNPSDAGRLLISLYLLKDSHPEFTDAVDAILKRTNYEKIATDLNLWRSTTSGYYAFYSAQGFSLFGMDGEGVQYGLNAINVLSNSESVDLYGVTVPVGFVTSEPLLLLALELGLKDETKDHLTQIYAAQESRYEKTGKLTAWTEGAYDNFELLGEWYLFQWLVFGSEEKVWLVTEGTNKLEINPVVFTKAGFAFHALFDSEYTKILVGRLGELDTQDGFIEGITEEGRELTGITKIRPVLTDKTNGMILSAARYALNEPNT